MITLLKRPQVEAPDIDDEDDFDQVCIYCLCRPDVSLCGAYDDGPYLPEDFDAVPDCADCVAVGTCPNCGC